MPKDFFITRPVQLDWVRDPDWKTSLWFCLEESVQIWKTGLHFIVGGQYSPRWQSCFALHFSYFYLQLLVSEINTTCWYKKELHCDQLTVAFTTMEKHSCAIQRYKINFIAPLQHLQKNKHKRLSVLCCFRGPLLLHLCVSACFPSGLHHISSEVSRGTGLSVEQSCGGERWDCSRGAAVHLNDSKLRKRTERDGFWR